MGKAIWKKCAEIMMALCVAQTALATEWPSPPPVPSSLAAPELSNAQRAAVEQAFREIRERGAQAAAAAPALPAAPAIPENLPAPPRFDAETQAKLDASFAPLAMQRANMGSLSPEAFTGTRAPASVIEAEASVSQEAPSSAPLPEGMSFLDFWPEDKKRVVAQELYLGLEKDEVPADSLLGRLLQAQRDQGSEEGSLFRQVRSAYRAREHLFQPVRVAGAGH